MEHEKIKELVSKYISAIYFIFLERGEINLDAPNSYGEELAIGHHIKKAVTTGKKIKKITGKLPEYDCDYPTLEVIENITKILTNKE